MRAPTTRKNSLLFNGFRMETWKPSVQTRKLGPTAVSDQRFIVFRGSSTYLFAIDDHRFEWGAPRIRGDVLKKLIGVDPTQYGVWQQSNEGEDKAIDNDKFANLQDRGLEVFFTAKKESTEGSRQ